MEGVIMLYLLFIYYCFLCL